MEYRPLLVSPSQDGDDLPTFALESRAQICATINLPKDGVLILPNGDAMTLDADAAYKPNCQPATQPAIIAGADSPDVSEFAGGVGATVDEASDSGPQLSDFRDPFYASTFPQTYALAATTVVAYTLVIMLLITPRSFLDGGVVVLGRRGFTNGGTGGTNIGGRPWLQKVAALTVAISLTIATADTFRVAEQQYAYGIQNAGSLQQEVMGGTELKVIRLISDTFLWLAQAQTLIRLFPRQREKIIIKWTAFFLVTLDLIFDSVNSFVYTTPGKTQARNFSEAVPALTYLFQLSLGVLYAAWVIYYAIMKKRFAFYHPQMRNMCLVAALSIIALLVPVVFFVLDISDQSLAGWGDYVRWVGAAAASVIVWEWVERIEALEREEKKDGILGREVFDGDEMMEMGPSDFAWPRRRRTIKKGDGDNNDGGESGGAGMPAATSGRSSRWPAVSSIANRYIGKSKPRDTDAVTKGDTQPSAAEANGRSSTRFIQPPLWPVRPAPAVTPVSRTDTASADSTVYTIRYHPLTETTSRSLDQPTPNPGQEGVPSRSNSTTSSHQDHTGSGESLGANESGNTPSAKRWRALAQAMPFRRGSQSDSGPNASSHQDHGPGREANSTWDIRSRLEDFAVTQAEKLRERIRPTVNTDDLPVHVIEAPPRRGAALAQVLEEEERNSQQLSPTLVQRSNSNASGATPTLWRSNSNPSAPVASGSRHAQDAQVGPLQTNLDIGPSSGALSNEPHRS